MLQCAMPYSWTQFGWEGPLACLKRKQVRSFSLVQTWASWQSLLARRYSRCYDCPTAPSVVVDMTRR